MTPLSKIPFVDQATIQIEAGFGGKGCRSFYRDRWTRHPIPDGGDGGAGGSVFIRVNPQLATLLDLKTKRHFRAGKGGHGSSKRKHGAQGTDCVIEVPCGTLLWDAQTGDLLKELVRPGEELLVAKGGSGGIGNSARLAPRGRGFPKPSLEGYPGEVRRLRLELKVIADVGIVGMPNAGKSTLLRQISQATPKVAPFAFTTTSPVLGTVTLPSGEKVVAVEVPGLIEGAHRGKGLGLAFLRHVERTKILLWLIDMAGSDGREPLEDYRVLNQELKSYDPLLLSKPQILVANKMDCGQALERLTRFQQKVKEAILPISAKTGQGLPRLLKEIQKVLEKIS